MGLYEWPLTAHETLQRLCKACKLSAVYVMIWSLPAHLAAKGPLVLEGHHSGSMGKLHLVGFHG